MQSNIGKSRCTPQHMYKFVLHNIWGLFSTTYTHNIWRNIYCGCMLWRTLYVVGVCCGEHSEKRWMCSTTHHVLWRTCMCCGQHLRTCSTQHRYVLSTTYHPQHMLSTTYVYVTHHICSTLCCGQHIVDNKYYVVGYIGTRVHIVDNMFPTT